MSISEQVALSRAFARYTLAKPDVQRDPVLSRRIERKVERLDRIVKTLSHEGNQLNSRLWNL